MKYEERRKLYIKAQKLWGEDSQCMVAIEEMGELIRALSKLWRTKNDKAYKKAKMLLQYEIADVDVMVEQLKVMFGESEVEHCKNVKLERLKGRVGL